MTLAARLARLEAERAQRRQRKHPEKTGNPRRQREPLRFPVVWDGVVIADAEGAAAYLAEDERTAGTEYRVTLPGEPA